MARLIAEKADIIPQLAEIFREHGYNGTSLALITSQTGLGKGSLYHFFPGGKTEMAESVLANIQNWFEEHVFSPLLQSPHPQQAIAQMFISVSDYFRSGQRVCLVGAMALNTSRDPFILQISTYFQRWVTTLADALARSGLPPAQATNESVEIIGRIQGAIVLARATGNDALFAQMLSSLHLHLCTVLPGFKLTGFKPAKF